MWGHMFGFNTASVASGLNGIAASIASGTHAINSTIGAVGNVINSIENLGNVLNGIFTGNYSGGISSNGISAAVATGGSPTEWLNQYISNAYSENGIIRYIYSKLFKDLMPDISGYTLLFMAPPVLSGYLQLGNQNYSINSTSFLTETTKLFPLLATNFTPPTIQLNSGALAGSSGTQHYASELSITDSMSVTYVDTIELDIYTFHSSWMQYIFQVLEGTLEPSSEYLLSRTIDYCASFYSSTLS